MHDDPPALLAIALETLSGQPLAALDPLEPRVGVWGSAGPSVEQGRFDSARARRVRIGFRRDIDMTRLRAPDQLERCGRSLAGAAVHVHDMHRRTGSGRVRDHLLKRCDRPADTEGTGRTEVDEDRRLAVRRHAEQAKQLFVTGTGRVADAEAEPEGALVELAPHQLAEAPQLILRGRLVEIRIRRPAPSKRDGPLATGLPDHRTKRLAPGALMAHRGTVVDTGPPLPSRIPGGDRIDSNLQLHRRRHPVPRLIPTALGILPVRVQIDEAGRHDETAGVEHLMRLGRVDTDRHDHAIPHGDVQDGVETALRIHDPATGDQQVDRPGVLYHPAPDREADQRRHRPQPDRPPFRCSHDIILGGAERKTGW